MRSRELSLPLRRVRVAAGLLLLPFLILSARAAQLSVLLDRAAARGDAQTQRVMTLLPERGTIVDRNGSALALSVDAPSVYAVPSELPDREGAARKLARALGQREAPLARRLRSHHSFVFLARWVDPAGAARVEALALPGVGILQEPRRVYPHRDLAGPLVGFANIDGLGVRGIEQQEDEWLRGSVRRIPVERDARGWLLAEGDLRRFRTAGGDIALTLDTALQASTEEALRRRIEATGAAGGLVVSLEARSGDLLALAEGPGFDPNHFRRLDYPATRSRAFLDAQEPGSTLKAFLVAAALDAGAIEADQHFDCENGSYRIPGRSIRDHHPNGVLTVAGILRESSNIGAVKIAFELGRDPYHSRLRSFGFGRPTGSDFPDESAGLLRPAGSWRAVDQAAMAFGQGLNVTAIQLAAATAALASGGEWRAPRIVAARRAAGGAWLPAPRSEPRRVVGREAAARVAEMLAEVVTAGTGRQAGLRGVRVAGKTGTAQKIDPDTGRYSQDRFTAWFTGFVPADDPLLVIVVALDEPRRPQHTGGSAAAPLFAEVAADHLRHFGIVTAPSPSLPAGTAVASLPAAPAPAVSAAPPREPAPPPAAATATAVTATAVAEAPPLPPLAQLHDRVLLPDFRGLTPEQVRSVTAQSALLLQLSGRGRAVSQDPPPGTVVRARTTQVRVRFESEAAGGEESS